jgi:hypothetical protein
MVLLEVEEVAVTAMAAGFRVGFTVCCRRERRVRLSL